MRKPQPPPGGPEPLAEREPGRGRLVAEESDHRGKGSDVR